MLRDAYGTTAPLGTLFFEPDHGTGQTATDAGTGGDHTLTVEPGVYVIMATTTGAFIFGLSAVTTAANVAWMCPAGGVIAVRIPIGSTALHYASLVNGGTIYLTKVWSA
jgi:hypothetical protein